MAPSSRPASSAAAGAREMYLAALCAAEQAASDPAERAQGDLSKFPRRTYTPGPTALHALPRLSAALGGRVNLWIKRDDQLGLVMGGNKTRKLEFAMASALQAGADCVITCGAVQSNHARLTLAAANVERLDCYLVLEERVPGSYHTDASGNHYLYQLLGAKQIRVVRGGEAPAAMDALRAELQAAGRHPYVIPGGASDPVGAKGYIAAAYELRAQLAAGPSGTVPSRVDAFVCASGSAGTHAGVVLGMRGSGIPVLGVSTRQEQAAQRKLVGRLADALATDLALPPVRDALVTVLDAYVGPGYSLPTDAMREAVELMAREEGILLDPVYTGKTFAGLVDLVRAGVFPDGANVVFLHTGGSPALFEYRPLYEGVPGLPAEH